MYRSSALVFLGALLLTQTSCHRTPTMSAPEFDATKVATTAMEMCDTDQDGYLTKEELKTFPGLLDGLRTIDKDNDGKIQADEIKLRIQELVASKNAAQIVECQFTRRGKPIAEARVTFEPEPFLADVIVAAEGTTDAAGRVELNCEATGFGVQPGFYRVRVSQLDGTKETIPAKYNEATTLGTEVSGLSRGNEIGGYFFKLD